MEVSRAAGSRRSKAVLPPVNDQRAGGLLSAKATLHHKILTTKFSSSCFF